MRTTLRLATLALMYEQNSNQSNEKQSQECKKRNEEVPRRQLNDIISPKITAI